LEKPSQHKKAVEIQSIYDKLNKIKENFIRVTFYDRTALCGLTKLVQFVVNPLLS